MTSTTTGIFLPYTGASPDLTDYLTFSVAVGGGPAHSMVMDTGSSGIVVPASRIVRSRPMPNPPPAPRYSSSGNTYTGQWVLATIELAAGDGQTFSTAQPVAVFAATAANGQPEPGVSMMGVGIRGLDGDAGNVMNPFLNLPEMAGGEFRTGYVLTAAGVQFGYDEAEMATFTTFPTNCADPDTTPVATVTLTPPAGSALHPYANTAPLLLDTGISYMIVTPRQGQAQPDAGYEETLGTQTQLVGGVGVSLALGTETIWEFDTRDCGRPATPAYARFARPSPTGIINTGRHLLKTFDYLVDVRFGPGGASGVVGLRPAR
ncbi:MAG TPA: hypothetical protein VGV85_07080 [Longimicrobiaceae bacterium]|nr:hypothetical protein [Longimicrobiaceae bacterium]